MGKIENQQAAVNRQHKLSKTGSLYETGNRSRLNLAKDIVFHALFFKASKTIDLRSIGNFLKQAC